MKQLNNFIYEKLSIKSNMKSTIDYSFKWLLQEYPGLSQSDITWRTDKKVINISDDLAKRVDEYYDKYTTHQIENDIKEALAELEYDGSKYDFDVSVEQASPTSKIFRIYIQCDLLYISIGNSPLKNGHPWFMIDMLRRHKSVKGDRKFIETVVVKVIDHIIQLVTHA